MCSREEAADTLGLTHWGCSASSAAAKWCNELFYNRTRRTPSHAWEQVEERMPQPGLLVPGKWIRCLAAASSRWPSLGHPGAVSRLSRVPERPPPVAHASRAAPVR